MAALDDELKTVRQLCEKTLDNTKLITCVGEMVMKTIKFIRTYFLEYPLCCCYDEVNKLKNIIKSNGTLKLKQKSCCIHVDIFSGNYEVKMRIFIPREYPNKCVKLEEYTANFPEVFNLYLVGQFTEIARQCVEPPLRKIKTKKQSAPQPFQIKPSLEPSVKFMIETVIRFQHEKCPVCKEQCLPDNPMDAIKCDKNPKHVERALCNHLYHQECLTRYLASPPFPRDGKKCLICTERLHHQKWGVNPRLAEDRWAHQQARERELDEVKDFLQ
ncbi:uncharacterized protein LOC113377745 isoform X2 [Ctenocephalides felis]|uniref:uncharacterized protein LOC113377745 isoform X2 n=1 Tax=Ctenocephalides felis TaxID=7515 RepID=UPI000E6E1174|nr:uncharacterized protein LOC113377745 isoform X2 [Ctenocephalides felis]